MLEVIGVILILVAFYFMMAYLIMLFSKVTNTRIISKTGSEIANPDSLKHFTESIKETGEKLAGGAQKTGHKVVNFIGSISNSKIEKLEKLASLKEKGLISHAEYEKLKNDLI